MYSCHHSVPTANHQHHTCLPSLVLNSESSLTRALGSHQQLMGTHREGPEMQCSLHCVITGLLYCASKNVTCLLSRVSLTIYQLKKFFLWYEKCSQMYFSNSPLEKIDIWKGSGSLLLSLVHRLAALVITWELVGSTDSWALPCAH